MTQHIEGPLYAEVMGPADAPAMIFVHPNPMDSACWLYQMAHFSTWYRCIAVDLPGYGRSPKATSGLTMEEVADACWEAVDRLSVGGPTVVVGCSVGSSVVQHMYHRRPQQTDSVIVCGTGYHAVKEFAPRRIAAYREHGLEYRYDYTFQDFSPEFGEENPLATWLAELLTERNGTADLESIITTFVALGEPDPDWLQNDIKVPTLIISGEKDSAGGDGVIALRDRIPGSELVIVPGAGHACQFEQPWFFDAEVIKFLKANGHNRFTSPEGKRLV